MTPASHLDLQFLAHRLVDLEREPVRDGVRRLESEGDRKQGRRAARLVPLGVQGAADAFRLLRVAAVDLDVRVTITYGSLLQPGSIEEPSRCVHFLILTLMSVLPMVAVARDVCERRKAFPRRILASPGVQTLRLSQRGTVSARVSSRSGGLDSLGLWTKRPRRPVCRNRVAAPRARRRAAAKDLWPPAGGPYIDALSSRYAPNLRRVVYYRLLVHAGGVRVRGMLPLARAGEQKVEAVGHSFFTAAPRGRTPVGGREASARP